jgi:hypothetical protein
VCECISLHLTRQSSRGHVSIATSLPEEVIESCISTLTKAITSNYSTMPSSQSVTVSKSNDSETVSRRKSSAKRGTERRGTERKANTVVAVSRTNDDDYHGALNLDCEEPDKQLQQRDNIEIPVKLLTAQVLLLFSGVPLL